jgi:hypothetical protein
MAEERTIGEMLALLVGVNSHRDTPNQDRIQYV